MTMIAQRSLGCAPCVCATAEALPFPNRAFDAALAVLTMHHWTDWRACLAEMSRVARRCIVVFTWTLFAGPYWFVGRLSPVPVAAPLSTQSGRGV